jgi:(4S)-4-hydroxy-5-phosphonooxypentane-2,3-dione isomerase
MVENISEEANKPFAVVVKAEIQPDRMAEFLKLIEINAVESRKEPGCIRFDVLRSQDIPNQFFFYELYENSAAMDYHKQTSHFQSWSTFKASGGTIESITYKTDPEFIP